MYTHPAVDHMRRFGFGNAATRISELARPAVRLRTTRMPADTALSTQIGGSPQVPAGEAWPRWKAKPLSFLAQLQLSELATLPGSEALPAKGMLQFWYETSSSVWGFDPADRGAWLVRFVSADEFSKLRALPLPDHAGEHPLTFPGSGVELVTVPTLPSWDSLLFDSLGLGRRETQAFAAALDATHLDELGKHQVLGHPTQLQRDMQLECQLVSHGLYCGDSTGYEAPQGIPLRRGALDWSLLFQLDSDESIEMFWGDAGSLYFWIPRHDLEAQIFDGSWMIHQCP